MSDQIEYMAFVARVDEQTQAPLVQGGRYVLAEGTRPFSSGNLGEVARTAVNLYLNDVPDDGVRTNRVLVMATKPEPRHLNPYEHGGVRVAMAAHAGTLLENGVAALHCQEKQNFLNALAASSEQGVNHRADVSRTPSVSRATSPSLRVAQPGSSAF